MGLEVGVNPADRRFDPESSVTGPSWRNAHCQAAAGSRTGDDEASTQDPTDPQNGPPRRIPVSLSITPAAEGSDGRPPESSRLELSPCLASSGQDFILGRILDSWNVWRESDLLISIISASGVLDRKTCALRGIAYKMQMSSSVRLTSRGESPYFSKLDSSFCETGRTTIPRGVILRSVSKLLEHGHELWVAERWSMQEDRMGGVRRESARVCRRCGSFLGSSLNEEARLRRPRMVYMREQD